MLLNDFALRSFRDVADGDYIAARMAYRGELIIQALWASQQALEKYIKAILLLRRIKRPKPTHSLKDLMSALESHFRLQLSGETRAFIELIEAWDVDRYFIYPYGTDGLELIQLDRAVWEIRRYCITYSRRLSPLGTPLEEMDIRNIEEAFNRPPQSYRSRVPGFLDQVMNDRKNPSRPALIWKNLYFGANTRTSLRSFKQTMLMHNSTLALHPEILDELRQYIFVPKEAEDLKR
jgi:HEPN domain-containing protein